jgi:hypothetical protein
MNKPLVLCLVISCFVVSANAQEKKDTRWFKSMYFQWGYNIEMYTRSDIHFKMGNGDRFTLHHARAHDRNNYDDILKKPLEISIPQYNYRIGFYLNHEHTKAVELNFDHAKYIVSDGQTVHVTGTIDGIPVDGDSVLNPNRFLHFEHTDGANWLHINYVRIYHWVPNKAHDRKLLDAVAKIGAGINIPRTDFTWRGQRLNNDFHVAGYNASVEGGLRFYPFKRIYIETTAKTGYVKYLNALANTIDNKGNRARQSFGYVEGIATIGFDIGF